MVVPTTATYGATATTSACTARAPPGDRRARARAPGGGAASQPASDPAPGHQLRGDHVALDLIGALADDHQRRIAEVAFDVVLGGIAVAAVDAHGVQGDLHGDLRREQLGHPGLHVGAFAAVVAFGRVAGELAGRGEFGGKSNSILSN